MSAHRTLHALLAAFLLVLVPGCAALPRDGVVQTAQPRPPAPQAADFYAGSPREDASPSEIVDDFLKAQSAGYAENGFDVAREYLMPSVAAQWDPRAPVRVYAEGSAARSSVREDGAIVVSADMAGTVDRRGVFTDAVPGTTAELRFSLVRDGAGQWRIAELEDGVLLSSYVFSTVFSSQPLYFLTQDRAALVPDLRWFPREDIASRVVEELLTGPADAFDGVADTALPEGAALSGGTVDVADGVASVDLTAPAGTLTESARSLAGIQVERTLFGVATVREVALTLDGERIAIDPGVATISSYPLPASSAPLGLRGGGVVRLGEHGAVSLVDAARIGGVAPDGLAQNYDGTAAVVRDGGTRLVTVNLATGASRTLLEGEALVEPSVDREDWVWTADGVTDAEGTVSSHLHVVSLTGEVGAVDAPWLEGRRVDAIAVSREGARVVVAGVVDGQTRVDVAAVHRAADGRPVALGDPVRIGTDLVDVVELAWVEDVMVAALARPNPQAEQPVVNLVQVGGTTSELPLVDSAVSVTASRGARNLVVGTTLGEIWVRNGAAWRVEVRGSVTEPAYPG